MYWWEENKEVIPERVVGKIKKKKEAEEMNELMRREKSGNTWKRSRKKKEKEAEVMNELMRREKSGNTWKSSRKKKREGSRSNEWIDEKRKEVIPERGVGKKKKRKRKRSNEWIDEKRKKR